jgi:hypothetical protein
MKLLRIQVDEFSLKGDPNDMDTLKEEVMNKVMDLIERDELEFTVIDEEDEEEEGL